MQREDRLRETENKTLSKANKRRRKKEKKKICKLVGGPLPKPTLPVEKRVEDTQKLGKR